MSLYQVIYKLFARPVRALFRVKIYGAENEPDDRACILCANHTSMLDVIVLQASMKRQIHYMAKAELFKIPLLRPLIRALGAFPINRSRLDMSTVKTTLSILKDGGNVGIFPQGTRYAGVDPKTTKIKSGAGMFAYHSGADVLPVYIGTPKNQVRFFRRTEIFIGKPISSAELAFSDGKFSEYTRASQYIFDRICSLPDTMRTADAEIER